MKSSEAPRTALPYAMAATATLLWFACVLPAGEVVGGWAEDWATPMHREAWLLVPGLLVLIIGPVGVVLAQARAGRLAVLATTDAFLAGYAALVLWGQGSVRGDVSLALLILLLGLSVLSLLEVVRVLRVSPEQTVSPLFRGLRLAICLLALLTPSWLLVRDGRELASLLAPFLVVAVSAGGAAMARAPLGLRFTASVVHALLAGHLLICLRYTLFDAAPAFARISRLGQATIGLSVLLLVLAIVQVLWLGRSYRLSRVQAPRSLAPIS